MGNPILLLHGALGSDRQMAPLKEALNTTREVYKVNLGGHGGRDLPNDAYDIQEMVRDLSEWIEENDLIKVDIFGYSLGGYVALTLAKEAPEKVGKVFTLGTKLKWDESSARKEVKMLNPDKIEEKVPAFAEHLQKVHAPQDWRDVVGKTADMMLDLPMDPPLEKEDLEEMEQEILLSVGDRDETAGVEDTLEYFKVMNKVGLWVIPNTPHPFEKVDMERLAREVERTFH